MTDSSKLRLMTGISMLFDQESNFRQAIEEKDIAKLKQAFNTLNPKQEIDFRYPFTGGDINVTPLGDAIFSTWIPGIECCLNKGSSTEAVMCDNETGYQHNAQELAELLQEENIVNLLKAYELSLTSIHLNEPPCVSCDCCYSDIEAHEVKVSCTGDTHHNYCKGCVEGMFKNTNFQNPQASFVCFGSEECHANFELTELKKVLHPNQMKHVIEHQALNALPNEIRDRIESCPKCGDRAEVPENNGPIYKCINEACQAESCRECGSQPHPNKSCNAADKERSSYQERIESAMSEAANPRRCANKVCNIPIEKISGCNKITCRCERVTCFVCTTDITDEGYEHFKNPTNPNDTRKCGMNDTVENADPNDIVKAKKLAIQKILREDPLADKDALERVGLSESQEAAQLMTPETCFAKYQEIEKEFASLFEELRIAYKARPTHYRTYTARLRSIEDQKKQCFDTLEMNYRRQAAYHNQAACRGDLPDKLQYMSLSAYVAKRIEITKQFDDQRRIPCFEEEQDRRERQYRHNIDDLNNDFEAQAAYFDAPPRQFDPIEIERTYRPFIRR